MFSVALIGPDGAGKSTVSRALVEWSRFPCKAFAKTPQARKRRRTGGRNAFDERQSESAAGTNTVVRVPAGQFSGRRVVPAIVVLELPGAWEHRFIMIDTSFSTFL